MGISYDVAIIGAGASGLAAAQELSQTGLRVAIVEARDRIGGRVYTLHSAESHYPIELGAEFIHGLPSHTWELIEASGLTAYEVPDNHWMFSSSKKHQSVKARRLRHFWRRIDRALSGIPLSGKDRSFREYAQSRLMPRLSRMIRLDRELAAGFVEGFNAASQNRISAQSLASSELDEAMDISRAFRLVAGYDRLLEFIWEQTASPACSVLLNNPIHEIRWEKGAVTLKGSRNDSQASSQMIEAQQAIITIPIGVLASDSIRFAPSLPGKSDSIRWLEMGQVSKIILRFNPVLWEELGLSKFGFIHASAEDSAFPAWWNSAPMQVPILTGWAGGPSAGAMTGRSQEEIVELAVYSLSRLFSVATSTLRQGIEHSYFHDWNADPYSRGAYSYVTAGGRAASSYLAAPVEGTLFFAGEATLSGGLNGEMAGELSGTVDGAIATGKRAAREVIASRRALQLRAA